MQILYKNAIREENYEVRYVTNGEEALEHYDAWSPDIVVLDIVMPIMSGFEALKRLKEKERIAIHQHGDDGIKKTVIIMVTAMGSKSDIMDCLKLGINGYIVKPINWETIESQIMGYYKEAIAKEAKP